MSKKSLVPVSDGDSDDDRRAVVRRNRMERRQRALAERNASVPAEVEEGGETAPVEVPSSPEPQMPAVRSDAFVLPPRAQLTKSASVFGRIVKLSLAIVVILPTLATTTFYAFVASEQYATHSMFAVRGSSTSTSTMDSGGLFSGAASSVTSEIADSFIVQEYIESREMVEALVSEANFLEIYSRPAIDMYYRLDPSLPVEKLLLYWQMMCDVEYDTDTGIINLTVRAFRPGDAETITSKVIEKSETLVNELSRRAREDSLKSARREVELAERRYSDGRKSVASYRGDEREIDPTATASARQSVVSGLEAEVAKLESQLTALRTTMSDNSPRVIYVRNQIDALERQVASERLRVAVAEGDSDQPVLTERLSRYEELLAEREFAEKAYISSLEMLEAARMDAYKQQRYLATIVRGSAPERATYPKGLRWTAVMFVSLLLAWGLVTVVAAALRDRVV